MLRTSDDGRCFLGHDGKPVFWLGDTQWELFHGYTFEEAALTLENRKRNGFSFIQVMLLGVKFSANKYGAEPFLDNTVLKPNEEYFLNVDRVINETGKHPDLNLVIGIYHNNYPKEFFTPENCGPWARWLAERYRDVPHLVWSMYPEAKEEYRGVCAAMAEGLRSGDGGNHLITVHPDPSPASSGPIWHAEGWLDFNSIQTFREVERIRSMTSDDRSREPAKPAVMAEGAYEAGIEYGFDVTPLWIRRQAYYSYFTGGHHSYGHNHSWRMDPAWKAALDAPGAVQMGILKKIFLGLPEWWKLLPDQGLLSSGGRLDGQVLTLAARHAENLWALVYCAEPAEIRLNERGLGPGKHSLEWLDPRSGGTVPRTGKSAGNRELKPSGILKTPAGCEDSLLIIRKVS